MDYQIRLSLTARRDLQEIVRYISIDAPNRATEFGNLLISKVKVLAQQPLGGRVVPEFDDESIRELVLRSYRIIYRVDHRLLKVEVIRFWHARRGVLDQLP